MDENFDIVILAAGRGTRMGLGETPKVLVNLAGKPLIRYIIDALASQSHNFKPVIVVGFKAEEVKKTLGPNFRFAVQEQQLGTGHAVMAARNQIRAENMLVLYGDMPFISASSLEKLKKLHMVAHANVSMFTTIVPDFREPYTSLNNFGRIIRDDRGYIAKITEFKDATQEERALTEVNPGIYAFNTRWLWDHISGIKNMNAQGEYYLTDIIEIAMKSGEKIMHVTISPNEVLGINDPDQLKAAESLLI